MKFPLSYATVINSSATNNSGYIFGDEHSIVTKQVINGLSLEGREAAKWST